jgi:hypothetical protein
LFDPLSHKPAPPADPGDNEDDQAIQPAARIRIEHHETVGRLIVSSTIGEASPRESRAIATRITATRCER